MDILILCFALAALIFPVCFPFAAYKTKFVHVIWLLPAVAAIYMFIHINDTYYYSERIVERFLLYFNFVLYDLYCAVIAETLRLCFKKSCDKSKKWGAFLETALVLSVLQIFIMPFCIFYVLNGAAILISALALLIPLAVIIPFAVKIYRETNKELTQR